MKIKTATLTILAGMNFESVEYFDIFKCEMPNISKFKASKIVKIEIFTFWNQPKLISRKIRVAEKWLNFHTVNQ